MKPNKDPDRGGRRVKDLKGKKLSVTQQAAVKGGIQDGTSNTIMFAEVKLPAVQLRPIRRPPSP